MNYMCDNNTVLSFAHINSPISSRSKCGTWSRKVGDGVCNPLRYKHNRPESVRNQVSVRSMGCAKDTNFSHDVIYESVLTSRTASLVITLFRPQYIIGLVTDAAHID